MIYASNNHFKVVTIKLYAYDPYKSLITDPLFIDAVDPNYLTVYIAKDVASGCSNVTIFYYSCI